MLFLMQWLLAIYMVTGQFADKPTRGWSSHGLVNSSARRNV